MAAEISHKYLTLKETGELCATPYAVIKRDIENKVLAAYKVGRKYFISEEEAQRYRLRRQALAAIDGYTIRQIMERIPLSYAFIIELIKSGRLRAVKVGRQYVVEKTELERFLQENQI